MQMKRIRSGRRIVVGVSVAAAAFAVSPSAFAHSSINPAVAKAKTLQPFTLELQAEEETARTTRVEVTFPDGFNVETFAASLGWKRAAVTEEGGDEQRVLRVVWTGGETSPRDDPLFHFTGTIESAKSYGVNVRQIYSDGSVENWSGPEGSETPAAFVEGVSSLGGGGSSTLDIVALAVAAVALLIAVVALVARGGGRPLA